MIRYQLIGSMQCSQKPPSTITYPAQWMLQNLDPIVLNKAIKFCAVTLKGARALFGRRGLM
jgi:hypothetical protein